MGKDNGLSGKSDDTSLRSLKEYIRQGIEENAVLYDEKDDTGKITHRLISVMRQRNDFDISIFYIPSSCPIEETETKELRSFRFIRLGTLCNGELLHNFYVYACGEDGTPFPGNKKNMIIGVGKHSVALGAY